MLTTQTGPQEARSQRIQNQELEITADAARRQCLQAGVLTRNTGSSNGEKSITVTFTGLGPCCWGRNSLGDTLTSRLLPWLTRPCGGSEGVGTRWGEAI